MANRILIFTLFQSLFPLMFSCNLSAQKPDGLIYNFNEPITQVCSELRASQVPECYANLLSINNMMSNYLAKKDVPKSLRDFLIDKKVVPVPANTSELKSEIFLLARYIHSVQFDSYLLMVTEEYVSIEEDDTKYLYLINVKSDTLISVCRLASYLSGIGLTIQGYSMYQGNDTFEKYFEEIALDVELIQEADKVKQKQGESFKTTIVVDSETGKISPR